LVGLRPSTLDVAIAGAAWVFGTRCVFWSCQVSVS
jgi:hypothetical protein